MHIKSKELPGAADDETVAYPCMNSRCTYCHEASGAALKEVWRFSCPECRTETLLDPDDLEFLLRSAKAHRAKAASPV